MTRRPTGRLLLAVPAVAVLLVPAGCGSSSCSATTLSVDNTAITKPGAPIVLHGKLVVESSGAGVPGAPVTVTLQANGHSLQTLSTTTGSDGSISLDLGTAGPRALLNAQNADSVALNYGGGGGDCASGTVGAFSLQTFQEAPPASS
jgi:hypothetical protein